MILKPRCNKTSDSKPLTKEVIAELNEKYPNGTFIVLSDGDKVPYRITPLHRITPHRKGLAKTEYELYADTKNLVMTKLRPKNWSHGIHHIDTMTNANLKAILSKIRLGQECIIDD